MSTEGFAAAKVNLWLHVGPPEPSGLHPISSLVVFADVGDVVSAEPADRLELRVIGDAEDLGAPDDNLVLKAARALGGPPVRLTLDKRLPVAAGLGGGSADAAAVLRLLGGAKPVLAIAQSLGSDVPMCLESRPVVAEGTGERLSPAPALPELHAVLVNPRAPCPTSDVYRRFDALGAKGSADRPELSTAFEDVADVVRALRASRNDLEPAAEAVQPRVGTVLARLRAYPETLLARMSGSGATCFALCEGAREARRLGQAIQADEPGWWARACRLGGPWNKLSH